MKRVAHIGAGLAGEFLAEMSEIFYKMQKHCETAQISLK
jgi:hypothetical protein